MPMFDYKCGNCDHHFEELIFASSIPDDEIKCPNCNLYQSKRQLSAPAVSVGYSFGSSAAPSGCSGSGFG